MSDVLSLENAERWAERVIAQIDAYERDLPNRSVPYEAAFEWRRQWMADRERVASDLAGLREALSLAADLRILLPRFIDRKQSLAASADALARRYSDGLRRTAELYGVTP